MQFNTKITLQLTKTFDDHGKPSTVTAYTVKHYPPYSAEIF